MRLNPEKDKDIIDVLDNVINVTKEVKKLLRIAIANNHIQ